MNLYPLFDFTWGALINNILANGTEVSPRGKLTKELPSYTVNVDMQYPVLLNPLRQLSYRFMTAEAYWILTGDNTVAGIAPWNSRMSEFSDDGIVLAGAYGPRIHEQLDYVIEKLEADPDTRQAGLTIWQPRHLASKDVPCTVAIFASLRGDQLNLHVFMRSSDVWLGLPYDVFSFSMLGHLICGLYTLKTGKRAKPGTLHLTAASSHLYSENWCDARAAAEAAIMTSSLPTPNEFYDSPQLLLNGLKDLRDTHKGNDLRWWEQYCEN